jgi:DNA-binding MarR family transcriptional regulator
LTDTNTQDTKSDERERVLLEEIEIDPDTTQADLAGKLGVAVGTVNWHVKRLIAKGYVKVKRAERRKLRYIITPEGIALRARLTVAYIENSMHLYRESRKQAFDALGAARERGYRSIRIEGDGDIADVVRLTCLEQGFEVVTEDRDGRTAVLEIRGQKIRMREAVAE